MNALDDVVGNIYRDSVTHALNEVDRFIHALNDVAGNIYRDRVTHALNDVAGNTCQALPWSPWNPWRPWCSGAS